MPEKKFNAIVIGGGPAGLSAAISLRQRGKSVAVISNSRTESGLWKAREIGNYPAVPGVSGSELSCKMTAHASGVGAELITGHVSAILPSGNSFTVGFGTEFLTAMCLILSTGIVQTSAIPGETELLGRGVSYCATCDGMLYRGKRVFAVCLAPDAAKEADYLSSIGCDVTRLDTDKITINGTDRVTSVTSGDSEMPCDGVFILRKTVAPQLLLTGLELAGGHIRTKRSGETNIPGVFAAGDCTGAPYQIAKAVGEGQVAALEAAEYIDRISPAPRAAVGSSVN